MKFLIAILMISTSVAIAAPMGPEAVEMAGVISHPQVKLCLSDINIGEMVSVKIEKRVARCPMCNTYVITGHQLEGGDIVVPEVTQITIIGRGITGFGEGFTQTYTCSVTTK